MWYIFIMNMWYIFIKMNTFESILMKWMKLEPIIQSEVSQKEKHKYSILMHIFMGFPGGSEVKASASNEGDPGLIPKAHTPYRIRGQGPPGN